MGSLMGAVLASACVSAVSVGQALACGRIVELLLVRRRRLAAASLGVRDGSGCDARLARCPASSREPSRGMRSSMRLQVVQGVVAVMFNACLIWSYVWLFGFNAAALPPIAWALVGSGAAYVITSCDLRARIIPWECCAALAVAGLALCAYRGDIGGLALSAFVALGAWLVVKLVAWMGRFRKGEAIGAGDVRAVPACVLFLGTSGIAGASPLLAGLLASGVACCGVVLVALALGRVRLEDRIPFGPFFSGWICSGMLAPPIVAALA